MDVIIKEVLSKSELRKFVLFPHSIYTENPYWVPPLTVDEVATFNKKKNPSFEYCEAKCWLAYLNGKIVGRIAGIINESYVKKWQRRYARFGWFDFIDDKNVSSALLETVESWVISRSMEALHGPLGFTDFDPEGMLIEGFDKIGTMTTLYNYPYYSHHIEKLGYKKDVDWVEYEIPIPQTIPQNIIKVANAVSSKFNLHVLKVKTSKGLLPYAKGVFDLVNISYSHLYGVVPLSNAQINLYTNQYFSFIDPEYVSLVLQNDSVVAFAVTIPSLSKALQKAKGRLFPFGFLYLYSALHKHNIVDLYLIAVHPDLQNKGVTAILIKDLSEKFHKNHVSKAITHPILEQNGKMQSFWKNYKKDLIKRRRCYIKFLNQSL